VIALLITIMVLELKIPHGASWEALRPLVPVFLTYVVSFTFVGIYWSHRDPQRVHQPLVSQAIYVGVALMWLVPDPRIEARLAGS